MRVAGLGSQRGVTAAEVIAAVEAALPAAGGPLDALAVLPAKASEPGIAEAARRLRLPLVITEAATEAATEARLASHSDASIAATGAGSASEAAALGAAGPSARLLGPRIVTGRVTCAIAIAGEAS